MTTNLLNNFMWKQKPRSTTERFFRVSVTQGVQLRHLDGAVRHAEKGSELVVRESAIADAADSLAVLFECDATGQRIVRAIFDLPERPKPATPSPYNEAVFDRWHDLAEKFRVCREWVDILHVHHRDFRSGNQPRPEALAAEAKARKALDLARDELRAIDVDAIAEAHRQCGALVIRVFDEVNSGANRLQILARELFGLRVASLGLTPAGVDRLFTNSELRVKHIVPPATGLSRCLGFDAFGAQIDYADDDVPRLFSLLRICRARLAEIAALEKPLLADLKRAKEVLSR